MGDRLEAGGEGAKGRRGRRGKKVRADFSSKSAQQHRTVLGVAVIVVRQLAVKRLFRPLGHSKEKRALSSLQHAQHAGRQAASKSPNSGAFWSNQALGRQRKAAWYRRLGA